MYECTLNTQAHTQLNTRARTQTNTRSPKQTSTHTHTTKHTCTHTNKHTHAKAASSPLLHIAIQLDGIAIWVWAEKSRPG